MSELQEGVVRQYNEEVGDSTNIEHQRILKQKYGLVAAILTPSEKYLIQKEERRGK